MKAIQVKYLPATNFNPTRLKAWIQGNNSVIQSKHYELSDFDNACEVAYSLALKLNWNCKFKGGSIPNGDYVFVIVESNCTLEVK